MNWSIYNNREVTVILWSDGTKNAFFSNDKCIDEFIHRKIGYTDLTYTTEKCMQSEYDEKYNGYAPRENDK